MIRPLGLFRWVMGISLAAGGVYGALTLETGARARSSYQEAEHFRLWFENPAVMARELEADFAKATERLSVRRGRGELTADDLRLEQDILEARHALRKAESPAKRAYFAYRDAYQMSSFPETDLSRRARLLAPAAKQSWREEMGRRALPVTDEMFDPEPGESADRRVVYSSQDSFSASNLVAILRSKGLSADCFDDGRGTGAARQAIWVTVPPADFWRAHNEIKSLIAPDLPSVFVHS